MSKTVKISRKDMAGLSTAETMALARETYGKLFRYIKPYRGRFLLGIIVSVLSGFSNFLLVQGMNVVFGVVLEKNAVPDERSTWMYKFLEKLNALPFSIYNHAVEATEKIQKFN